MRADPGGDEALPRHVLLATQDGRVLSALEGFFRRNAHADKEAVDPRDPRRWRQLALQSVRKLLDPDTGHLADVGGLRLHLWVPSAPYAGPAVIHVYVWDEEAGVWRLTGDVVLGEGQS